MSSEKTSQRMIWADAIRVLAIFLVVLTHCLGIGYPSPPTFFAIFTNTFFLSLVRVAVPLFVMLSGALLLNREESAALFYKKRVVKVLLPWIMWTMIYFLWQLWYLNKSYQSVYAILKDLYIIFMSSFWFLPMLLALYILTPVLRKLLIVSSKRALWRSIGVWMVVFSLLPIVTSFLHIPQQSTPYYVFEHIGFYILGYLLIYPSTTISQLTLFLLFTVSLAVQMLGISLQKLLILPIGNYLDHNLSPFVILASITAWIFLYNYFTREQLSEKLKTYITQLALVSFGIYFIHGLLKDMLKSGGVQEGIENFPFPYPLLVLLQTGIIFSLSGIIIYFIRKRRVGKYLAP